MNPYRRRPLGRFFVSETMLVQADAMTARAIFDGLIIRDATHAFDKMGTYYLAEGDQFDEMPEGTLAPMYDVKIQPDGSVTFVREDEDNANSHPPGI